MQLNRLTPTGSLASPVAQTIDVGCISLKPDIARAALNQVGFTVQTRRQNQNINRAAS